MFCDSLITLFLNIYRPDHDLNNLMISIKTSDLKHTPSFLFLCEQSKRGKIWLSITLYLLDTLHLDSYLEYTQWIWRLHLGTSHVWWIWLQTTLNRGRHMTVISNTSEIATFKITAKTLHLILFLHPFFASRCWGFKKQSMSSHILLLYRWNKHLQKRVLT